MVRLICSFFIVLAVLLFSVLSAGAHSSSVELMNTNYLRDVHSTGNFSSSGIANHRGVGVNFSSNFDKPDAPYASPDFGSALSSRFIFSTGASTATLFGTAGQTRVSDLATAQNATTIPEPSSGYLFVAGVMAVVVVRVRRFFVA
jgi:hypothetical protein